MSILKKNIMKVNRRDKALIYVYVLAIIGSLALFVLKGPMCFTDTPSYLKAWDYMQATGHLDVLRTPVYPCILGVLKSLFPTFYTWIVVLIQTALSFISIYCFYVCANDIIKKKRITYIITILYALVPIISTIGNNALLTEPFSVSGLVLLLYFSIKLYKNPQFIYALLYTFFLLFLIFLRPIFIYLLPVFVLFWIILIREKSARRSVMYGIAGVLITLSCVLTYMYKFKSEHGVFALTNVSTYNQLFMTRQSGLLNPSFVKDSAFREELEFCYRSHGSKCPEINAEVGNWLTKYDIKMLNEAISNSYKEKPTKSLSSIYDRVYNETVQTLDWIIPMPDIVRKFFKFFCIGLGTVFLFVLLFGVLVLKAFVKFHMIPIWSFLLFALVVSNLVVIFLGAQNDYQRLFLPSLPLVFIMVGKILACSSMKFSLTALKDE